MAVTNGQPVQITFRIMGATTVEETIRKYTDRLKDIRPVGDALINYFRSVMQKQFESSGAYLGDAWVPLAQSTIEDKTRRGTVGNGILRDSLDLYYSLTGGGRGAIQTVTEDSVTFGSSIYYLGYLDGGTRKMPARPVYGDKDAFLLLMEKKFSSLVSDHVKGEPIEDTTLEDTSGASEGHTESLFHKAVHELVETVKKGREKGDEWAENWSNSSESGGGGGGGGGANLIGGM